MVGEVFASLGAFKTMMDMAKALKDINDATIRNGAVIELQEKILAARNSQEALLKRISDLEKEVARFETWETEKQRYVLTEIGTGVFAYVLKQSMGGTEPVHCICSQCYERDEKSILQKTGNTYGSVTMRCPKCKTEFFASEDHPNYPLKREYASDLEQLERATLDDCPLCRIGKLKVTNIASDPAFGVLGIQRWTLECDNQKCKHKESRQLDPMAERK